jgi:peptidoglycan/LPS O-acetylase OafA/YrhL
MGTFRFLLAIAVAVGHAEGLWGHRLIDGQMAVQCFYMVSGFLISLILSGKYDTSTASGLRLFYTNRALRIFVPYWTFLLLILVTRWATATGGALNNLVSEWPDMSLAARAYLLLTNLLVVGQEWTAWLSYDHGSLTWVWDSNGRAATHLSRFFIIPQAWTMSLELMFYALAPFLVRRHWLALVAYIAATYAARELLMLHGFNGSGFVYRFFPLELGLFLGGVLAHRAFAFWDAGTKVQLTGSIVVTAALLAMLFVLPYWWFWEGHRFYLLVALALPSLFQVARRFPLDRWLGELSYPIYLVHLAVLSIGGTLATRWPDIQDHDAVSLTMIIVTVLIAIAYVHWIDVPFERWRQRRATKGTQERTPRSLSQPQQAPISA